MHSAYLTLGASALALTIAAGPSFAGPDAMNAEEARHFLNRTGFGAAPYEIDALVGMSYADAVQAALDGMRTAPSRPMPAWTRDWPYPAEAIWTLSQTEAELFITNRWLDVADLGGWWLAEMVATPTPLTERMTLFWHDHFATSFDGIENGHWIADQNALLREHAAGNFADLAAGILRDPAMLAYLSNLENIAEAPNEDLGREFLELFTLGEGRGYTQDDVRAAAAILTGHTVQEYGSPTYEFRSDLHDSGKKTLFGERGRFEVSDLVSRTLSHPEFGPYVVEKLWLEFISDQPDPAEIARLTAVWKDNDLDLKPLLQELFLSEAFWAPENRGRLVKGPVDLLVGLSRTLGIEHGSAADLMWATDDLGQSLFFPPNVGGWPQGSAWITDATASSRSTLLTWIAYEAYEPVSDEDRAGGDGAMMMANGSASAPVSAGPEDLRVGQVLAQYTESYDEEEGGLFILYDVGFGGQDWRSITFWLGHEPGDDFAGIYLNTNDCAPGCFVGWPASDHEEPLVDVTFEPWEGLLDEEPDLRAAELGLMQAIAGHMPALIASTEGQRAYDVDPEEFDESPATTAQMVNAAEKLARQSQTAIGAPLGELVFGFSRPGALGLAGADAVASEEDLDAYVEAREEATAVPVAPAVRYDSAAEWVAALPGVGLPSERAAMVLLAVPRRSEGQRDEMFVDDPEALLRSLILAPEFQLK